MNEHVNKTFFFISLYEHTSVEQYKHAKPLFRYNWSANWSPFSYRRPRFRQYTILRRFWVHGRHTGVSLCVTARRWPPAAFKFSCRQCVTIPCQIVSNFSNSKKLYIGERAPVHPPQISCPSHPDHPSPQRFIPVYIRSYKNPFHLHSVEHLW